MVCKTHSRGTQAGTGRAGNQQQEQISPNLEHTIVHDVVHALYGTNILNKYILKVKSLFQQNLRSKHMEDQDQVYRVWLELGRADLQNDVTFLRPHNFQLHKRRDGTPI